MGITATNSTTSWLGAVENYNHKCSTLPGADYRLDYQLLIATAQQKLKTAWNTVTQKRLEVKDSLKLISTYERN